VLGVVRKGVPQGADERGHRGDRALTGFEGYQGGGALTLAGALGVAFDELTAK
jgi:hypothetical protein